MSNKTGLRAELEELFDSESTVKWSDGSVAKDLFLQDYNGDQFSKNDIEMQYVDGYGGEGEGETYYNVYSFTKEGETVYYQFDGSYCSYDGAYFDEYFEVIPKEEIITVYERV